MLALAGPLLLAGSAWAAQPDDSPTLTFLSSAPGSGDNATWKVTLPRDPSAMPGVAHPGSDVSHWFELAADAHFSMAVCDPSSYPQLPCTPESDANAPACPSLATTCSPNSYPGGGSAEAQVQLYSPGEAPFIDAESCDNTHWCAGLRIQSLICTVGFHSCNIRCEEPVNFAFIQTNGTPTGPPAPQQSDAASSEPNAHTLLMNPGDQLTIHMFDAAAPAVPTSSIPAGKALKAVVDDLTTGTTGYMQASAANGFGPTGIDACEGGLYNFEPEYATASRGNTSPWSPLQGDIAAGFDIGAFEPCTSATNQSGEGAGGSGDPIYSACTSPYESGGEGSEPQDAPCFPGGDTHGTLDSPGNEITGCLVAAGDLDFDGSSYWTEWPTGLSPTSVYPGALLESAPTSNGHRYAQWFAQTDVALDESSCQNSATKTSGCTVPPPGPGKFYPYFSQIKSGSSCSFALGNLSKGSGVVDFGGAAQYGSDQDAALGFPEFEGPTYDNTCPAALPPPSARILSPAAGRTFNLHQRVLTRFTCTEAPGGPGIASCKDSGGRTSPGVLNTSTVGHQAYTVTARSKDGQSARVTIHYTVAGPPSVSITTPRNGASYHRGQSVTVAYRCTDGPFGPGLSAGGCHGPVVDRAKLNTLSEGRHSFTVRAASRDGQTATKTVHYTVSPPRRR